VQIRDKTGSASNVQHGASLFFRQYFQTTSARSITTSSAGTFW
jgi:hypothetical protein